MGGKRKMQRSATKKIFPNPFLNYLREFRREMQGQNVSMTRLFQMAGQRWREMTPEQRLPYIELAEKARKSDRNKKRNRKYVNVKTRKYRSMNSPRDAGRKRKRASSGTSASQSYSSSTSTSSHA